jgi:1,4-alpha-glucan branching enzyme
MKRPGELAIVLHTHMPYVEGGAEWPPRDYASLLRSVEGFGTWPFGEEWLWEAIATCYLPLLGVLGRAPLTLSLTPVLCDQLEAPGAIERCLRFLTEVRPESHRLDIEELRGQPELVAELQRSAAEYAGAATQLESVDLLRALGEHSSWTSAATHAVLPLLASDPGIALQVQTGVASHRRRFGEWGGGFWLPECAYAPWLDRALEEAGVRHACVELPGGGPGPLRTEEGPVLWPIDRQTIDLVWSPRGYPADGAYRDTHRLTPRHHRLWANDGRPYHFERARARAAAHARAFVEHVRARVDRGGLCVCALDSELLGHWWYEGPRWLEAAIDESARQGLALTTLDDALERYQPAPAPAEWSASSWGEGGDLRTWSGPPVAELAWRARTAELKLLASAGPPPARALRELLALQSSDWAFLAYRQTAGDYPRERFEAHADAFAHALAGEGELEPGLRNLAPELAGWLG